MPPSKFAAGQVTCLTMEHNPNTNDDERLRVQAAGGRIEKMHWCAWCLLFPSV